MTTKEIIELIKARVMFNEITDDELWQIMDICECGIINRMAARACYWTNTINWSKT